MKIIHIVLTIVFAMFVAIPALGHEGGHGMFVTHNSDFDPSALTVNEVHGISCASKQYEHNLYIYNGAAKTPERSTYRVVVSYDVNYLLVTVSQPSNKGWITVFSESKDKSELGAGWNKAHEEFTNGCANNQWKDPYESAMFTVTKELVLNMLLLK